MKHTLKTFLLMAVLLCTVPAVAQEGESKNNTFGGWEFFEISHSFKDSNWFTSLYFEHDNYQYKRLECWYTRFTLGYKINSWLKTDIAYDTWVEAVKATVPAKFLELNLKAFDLGYNFK